MVFGFFEEHNRLSWFVTIVGAVGIFIVSSLTFASGGTGSRLIPILYHILSFFFFGLFLLIALVRGERKYLLFFVGIFVAVSYGVLDEVHQFFVPGRACTGFDVFLDGIGVVFAAMVYLIRVRLKGPKIL